MPAWEEYSAAPGEVVIRLEPGMAFGTGLHPTTRLCLEALEAHLAPGGTVLDVGTGSGVLAIAAAKLGARSVLALDADPVAVAVARENVAGNGVADARHRAARLAARRRRWCPATFWPTMAPLPLLSDRARLTWSWSTSWPRSSSAWPRPWQRGWRRAARSSPPA